MLSASYGMGHVFVTSLSYQSESFRTQVASLVALAGLLRNLAAAIAAVVIEPLTNRMGLGWCFTGLALVVLVICLPSVLLVIRKGTAFREAMQTAAAAREEKGAK